MWLAVNVELWRDDKSKPKLDKFTRNPTGWGCSAKCKFPNSYCYYSINKKYWEETKINTNQSQNTGKFHVFVYKKTHNPTIWVLARVMNKIDQWLTPPFHVSLINGNMQISYLTHFRMLLVLLCCRIWSLVTVSCCLNLGSILQVP